MKKKSQRTTFTGDHYKAFLSYSHRDSDFARWLHRKIESWGVPKELIGRKTLYGPVPRSLQRSVFRDRDDFAGGASLKKATISALKNSDFIVVLCSTHTAKSAYVNEEVRLFKAMGRADRVIPFIIDGEPGDPEKECFPDAVKYTVDADGEVTDRLAEPAIAPDARVIGDGRQRAVVKLVAGLLGLPFDEIARRADQVRRRRNAILAGVATGAFIFATVFSAYALWQSYQARLAIERSVFAISGLIQETDRLADSTDPEEARNAMLLSQCDLIDGLVHDQEIIGVLARTVCLGMRAREAVERGDTVRATEDFDAWLDELHKDFKAMEHPSYDLATGLVRAAVQSYVLHDRGYSDNSHTTLARLVDLSHMALSAHPESIYLHNVNEMAMWSLLQALEERGDYVNALELMQLTTQLRIRQATYETDENWHRASFEAGLLLRRSAYVAHKHLGDMELARVLADDAVVRFKDSQARTDSPVEFSFEFALAHEVRGDILSESLDQSGAVDDFSRARVLLLEIALDDIALDTEWPAKIQQKRSYIEGRLSELGVVDIREHLPATEAGE